MKSTVDPLRAKTMVSYWPVVTKWTNPMDPIRHGRLRLLKEICAPL